MRAIGRLEKTTEKLGEDVKRGDDRLAEKIEGVHEKLGSQAQDIVANRGAYRDLRKDFDEFRDEVREKERTRGGFKSSLTTAIAGGLAGAGGGGVVALITALATHH